MMRSPERMVLLKSVWYIYTNHIFISENWRLYNKNWDEEETRKRKKSSKEKDLILRTFKVDMLEPK